VFALAIVALIVALVLALAAVSWFLGWGLGSVVRSSLVEAGERTSHTALHFWDWVRLGR
jgi:hypothetical protein